MKKVLRLATLLLLSSAATAPAADRPIPTRSSPATSKAFKNLSQIASDIGLDQYRNVTSKKTLKIAILDLGFRDHQSHIGKTLPAGTKYHQPAKQTFDPAQEDLHGTVMAQIASGLLKEVAPRLDYELHLFNAYLYTNLAESIKEIVNGNFDVVLYSQVWEYGGNNDGRGFINRLVNQATANGTIWINAAGNYGTTTYRGPILRDANDWVKLPGKNNSVTVRCDKSAVKFGENGKCKMRLVLTWNSFADDQSIGTDKDLDFVLEDDVGKQIGNSVLKQVTTEADVVQGQSTLYPREVIQAEVKPGTYYVRIKDRSKNFTKRDQLRVLLNNDHFANLVSMPDATPGESILAPADNESVITVGGSDAEKSGYSVSTGKPEILVNSAIELSGSNKVAYGSSNAAAITYVAAALLKAVDPSLTRGRMLSLLQASSAGIAPMGQGTGLPIEVLNFEPTGNNCFRLTNLPFYPKILSSISQETRTFVVDTSAGPKVFTPDDPFALAEEFGVRLNRMGEDDMVVVTPNGLTAVPRQNQDYMQPGSVELVQIPEGQSICSKEGRAPMAGLRAIYLRLPPIKAVR